jgi:predicted acylesterase/phospholipase RssA
LIFSGGGAKGSAYIGACYALMDNGIIKGIDSISGSSVGAFNAIFIAIGTSKENYYKLFSELSENILNLIGDQYFVNKDLNKLSKFISYKINDNISQYFKAHPEILKSNEVKKIQEKIDNSLDINFRDLATLRQIDPETFKGLAIAAMEKDSGKLQIFDYKNNPDTPIVKACIASMSLIPILESCEINGIEYIDGGLKDILPIKYFQEQDPNARILGFDIATGDCCDIAINSMKNPILTYSNFEYFFYNFLQYFYSIGCQSFKDNFEDTYQIAREYSLSLLNLDSGTLSTLSFEEVKNQSKFLLLKSYNQTLEYLHNHNLVKDISSYHLNEKNFIIEVYKRKIDGMYRDYVKETIKPIIETLSIGSYFTDFIANMFEPIVKILWPILDTNNLGEKSNEILDFAEQKYWKNKDSNEVLTDFIKKILTEPNGNLSINNLNLSHLIDQANDASTPINLKWEIANILNIDRIDSNSKNIRKDLIELIFEPQDFVKFSQNNQEVELININEEPEEILIA